MRLRGCFFIVLLLAFLSPFKPFKASAEAKLTVRTVEPSFPFSIALDALQKKLGYQFHNIVLLRRAMTHPSYSEENNTDLAVLGTSLIETTFSLQLLTKDVDMSSKDLSRRISDISKVDGLCTAYGKRLGLQNVIRVSPKTDSSASSVVCSAFRAVFGAIAVDSGKSDDAGTVFWKVYSRDGIGTGGDLAMW